MSAIRLSLLLVLAATAGGAAARDTDLRPYVAEYQIKASILRGTLRTEVAATNPGWRAMSSIRAEHGVGKFAREAITEQADFHVENGRVVPMRYSSSDPLSNRPKELDFAFDHDAGTVSGTVNEVEYVHDLGDGLYDRVTIQVQLALDMSNGGPQPNYRLMNGKRIKDLPVSRIAGKTISTPIGEFETVGIENVDTRKERRTVLWCAEELGYLPVAIEQYRKGRLQASAILQSYVSE